MKSYTDQQDTAFTDRLVVDKIVDVISGTATMNACASFAASWQGIPVGNKQTEKHFTQMIWSDDGGASWQDGDAQKRVWSGGNVGYYYAITCYSDPTTIYLGLNNNGLVLAAPAQTIMYIIFVFSTG
jgi:hypothetical protein